jgi:hypothetical protein
VPSLLEGTVIPCVLFVVIMHSVGMTPALWSSLLWSGCSLGRRIVFGQRLTGLLILGGFGTGFRLITVLWTSSPFIFFLQPVLATVASALVFGLSVPLGRPLAAKLGADLVPLGEDQWSDPAVRAACSRLSLVWCGALLANAALTLWMLSTLSVATFVLLRPFVGVVTTLPAIVTSFVVGAAVVRRSEGRVWVRGAAEAIRVAPGPVLVTAG